MGRLIRDEDIVPELILTSTAVRAASTARLLAREIHFAGAVTEDKRLYLAEPKTYLSRLHELSDSLSRVMVVGHNPGIEELLEMLTGRRERMPTAALAAIELNVPSWRELRLERDAKLIGMWRPKELD
jgi:phosphohistidine phosphatase